MKIITNRFRPVSIYVSCLMLFALCLDFFILQGQSLNVHPPNVVFGTLALLFVWHFGLLLPYLGMVSMEGLVYFHMLLTMPLFDLLLVSSIGSLLLPFLNRSYRSNSYYIAGLKAMNNIAMNNIMLLAAYLVIANNLTLPLQKLDLMTTSILITAALLMQSLNVILLITYFNLKGKKTQKLLPAAWLLSDLMFFPFGLLSAMLYQNPDQTLFYLFCFLMVLFLVAFNFISQKKNQEYIEARAATTHIIEQLGLNSVLNTISYHIVQLFDEQCIFLFVPDTEDKQKQLLINEDGIGLQSQQPEIIKKAMRLTGAGRISFTFKELPKPKVHGLATPFKDGEGVFAYLIILSNQKAPYLQSDVSSLKLVANRYAMSLSYALNYEKLKEYKKTLEEKVSKRTQELEAANEEKNQLLKKLEALSYQDELTGLYNRRHFEQVFGSFFKAPPDALSLAIFDLDYFKTVNDNYGHEAGDLVLKELADILNKMVNKKITPIRFGGEEFILLFKNKKPQKAEKFCQDLVLAVAKHRWRGLDEDEPITISIGLSHYPQFHLSELFSEADKQLYRAKAGGRNQLKSKAT